MTTLEMHWNPGAEDCSAYTGPPLEVHPLDARTFVLRESLCATWEAPFMYLLVGQERGLLIDTGDVADPGKVPLASTVLGMLPSDARGKLPLLVVHSHSHTDHRAGDPQFEGLPGVRVVPADLDHVREYFGFTDWPNGTAHVDLGGRRVDVLPAPGHSPAHLLFYDQDAGFLFSGDFLMPGRLLVNDFGAYLATAQRIAELLKDRPVSLVLGGHVEKDREGKLLPWQSTVHPGERPLPLARADVVALPAALRGFNGFYSETPDFVIMNPTRNLVAMGMVVVVVLTAIAVMVRRVVRRRRRRQAGASSLAG